MCSVMYPINPFILSLNPVSTAITSSESLKERVLISGTTLGEVVVFGLSTTILNLPIGYYYINYLIN